MAPSGDPPASGASLESNSGAGAGNSVEQIHRHRRRLERMARLRIDRRLSTRVDASDVVQEVFVEALRRFDEYQRQDDFPLFLWLRFLTAQKIVQLTRYHLRTCARNVDLEIRIHQNEYPQADSRDLARKLIGRLTTPLSAAVRAEKRQKVQEALEVMDPLDREVLVLRHFEQLTNKEVSLTLGIPIGTASSRYLRSLEKLKALLR